MPVPGLYSISRRYLVSFALLYGLIPLHPIAMNTFIKHKSMEKNLCWIARRHEWNLAAPCGNLLLATIKAPRLQLARLNKLLNENDAFAAVLANFRDHLRCAAHAGKW